MPDNLEITTALFIHNDNIEIFALLLLFYLDEAKVTDVLLKLDVNFEAKVLAGAVTLTVERANKSIKHVVSSPPQVY